jgi:carboxypeptidase T
MGRICSLFILLVVVFSVGCAVVAADSLLRINVSDRSVLDRLPPDLDIAGSRMGQWIDVVASPDEIRALRGLRVPIAVLCQDVEQLIRARAGSYHSYPDVVSMIEGFAADYPQLTVLTSLGTTYEGREILCLEISDNPGVDEGEPVVVFTGLHHAREWPTVEICLHIIDKLLSGYGTDQDITDVVNGVRLFVVVCVNPDGYVWSHDSGHDWRKNRRYFPEFNTRGVDPNRNYGGSCNGDAEGEWGSAVGTTHYPSSEVYCGPTKFSEAEAQAIRDLVLEVHPIALITWHTYGEELLYPWGYSTGEQAPDDAYLKNVSDNIAARITKQSGYGTYDSFQSSGLYPTTGDTTDWAYGCSHYVEGTSCFAFTIEACSEFQPSASKLDQIVAENYDGGFYLLQIANELEANLVPRVMPPVLDPLPVDGDGEYTISWTEKNPAANPDRFALEELTGLTVDADGAEGSTGRWVLNGFTTSTAQKHSGSRSYYSNLMSGARTVTMTSKYPLPVTAGDMLEFWTYYRTEANYDYAYVDVSRDGRDWQILDDFNGSSSGWEHKQYSLDEFAGQSIYIRFRYLTDAYTFEQGFFVDDIQPVPDFASQTTLSDNIAGHSFEVTGRSVGEYYYRAAGHNAERGWGDYSQLLKVRVATVPPDGFFSPLWVQFSLPLEPFADLDPRDLFGDAVFNLFRWDGVGKTWQLWPEDFQYLHALRGYAAYLPQAPDQVAFDGYHLELPIEIPLGAQGMHFIGLVSDAPVDPVAVAKIRNNAVGSTRTCEEDRGAPDPWINWNWVYWNPHFDTYQVMSPGGGGDDKMIRPWYAYWVWSNIDDGTLVFW